jgi:hypothetical protein
MSAPIVTVIAGCSKPWRSVREQNVISRRDTLAR